MDSPPMHAARGLFEVPLAFAPYLFGIIGKMYSTRTNDQQKLVMGASVKSSSGQSKPNYFGKEITALKIGGVALAGNEGFAYKIYSVLILYFLNLLYTILDFAETFKHDFDVVIDMSIYLFAGFLAFVKAIVVLRNRKIIFKTLEKLEKEPFTPNYERGGDEEVKIIGDYVWITFLQSVLYWTFAAVTIFTTVVYTLVVRLRSSDYQDWQFAYGPLTVLNTTYSPNFEITWIYQNLSISAFALNFVTVDLLMANILAHISMQFKILQNNVRRIVVNSYIEMKKDTATYTDLRTIETCDIDASKIPWRYLKKSLKTTVDYHLAILEIASEMEDVFNELLLLVFLGVLSMLSFLIYNGSTLHNPGQFIRCMGETLSAILEVATVCYWGEQVMVESQEVGRAVFEVNFTGSDVRFQKALALIIRRSQKLTRLTAGKFTDINLATFTWILRTSYSAFLVLRRNGTEKI